MGSLDHPFNPVSVALGVEATFVARSSASDRKHLTEVLAKAAAHKGTAFVEIYQNCNIFNDGAFDLLKEPDTRADNQIRLEHGKPIRFGADGEHGVRLVHHEVHALALLRDGGVGRFVGHCVSSSGATLWWDAVLSPIQGAGGRPERILAISRDVTGQKRQAEFEQQLIGIVSHDLRNPIAAMIMGASLIKLKTAADSPLASTAGRIVKSGERATRLIRDLLDFTQVRLGGGVPIERRAADIHAVCAQAVEEVALNHADRTLVHEDAGDGRGAWDADRLAQVVGNLVRNAVSYGEPGAPITVSSVGRATTVEVRVHNHGKPIAADVLPTLFEPFKRGDRRHDPERSVGLGLFIVREIVAAHGGAVEVCSDADHGTCFLVTLPRGA